MSTKITFDICMVKINRKLSSIDLTPVNHIKDETVIGILYPGFGPYVLGPFLHFNGKFQQ